jgi:glycosyltransferase involved in cell wall biosynthesis
MRVLAVTHSLGANGAAVCLCRVLIAIKAAGGSADVIYSGNEVLAQTLRDHGVGVIEQAQTSHYDVALVNTLMDHRRVIELAPALPVVFWVHEGTSGRDGSLNAAPGWIQAFRLSSRLVFVNTPQSQAVFKSFLDSVEPHRVLHVAPAVRIASDLRGERVLHKTCSNIISVGSVYPRKRPADLVAAVVRMALPDVRCTFLGNLDYLHLNGPAMQEALARQPQVFTLAGEVMDESQKIRYLRTADVFCSTSGDESFPMTPVEAASMGLPLALSDLPCYKGVWQHGVNALLAPVGSVDCISWNLMALTHDPDLARRLGQAAQRTAERFTMERFLNAMFNALTQAIQDPVPRPTPLHKI